MLYQIKNVLSAEHLKDVRSALANGEFVDGKLTAGKFAKGVKDNLELTKGAAYRNLLNQAVMSAIMQNQEFQQAALPKRISKPIFAKYTEGMCYGTHVDDPVMGEYGKQYRSDVSLTLFLSEPDEYEGGELAIATEFGERKVKLNAGDMVVYPSSSLHQVMPVKAGTRLVMITWLQSMVKNPAKRTILYDLSKARDQLLTDNPQSSVSKQIDVSFVNLVRMWAKP